MGLQQHFHSRLGTKLRAKFRPIQPIAVFPVVLSEATPNATVTMETQRLFAADCNRRPAAMAAAISGDNYCVGWQEWVPFGVWLCEEYPLLLRSEGVVGRRDQCRLAAGAVQEAIVWGVIKDPLFDDSDTLAWVNAPTLSRTLERFSAVHIAVSQPSLSRS